MVETPWGASDSLRSRMLPPGPATPPEDVARNQRERLFGAMVASVASRGYSATRVTDLIELSGISRRSFYALYPDKEACFKEVVAEIVAGALKRADPSDVPAGEERARQRFQRLAAAVIEQPAAARLCLIEAHAAGPEALRPVEDAVAAVEKLMQIRAAEMPERAGTPPEMIGALVGSAIEVIRTRLRRGEERELAELAGPLTDFLLAYRPPPRPLRLGTRLPTAAPETLAGHDHQERALRAFAAVVAERGYENTTIEEVVRRASMSPTTFYANFAGKREALIAAIDNAGAQLSAAVVPSFRRNPDWPTALRAAYVTLFNFMASRPAMAHLVLVDVYAAGPEALSRREETLRSLRQMLEEGRRRAPEVSDLAIEAIVGAVASLAYKQVREGGVRSLPALAPLCAYLSLAPFIGAEQACAVANGETSSGGTPDQMGEAGRQRELVLHTLTRLERPADVEEISRELETPTAEVEAHLEALVKDGVAKRETGEKGGTRYAIHMPRIDEEEWTAMSRPERERLSQHIGYLVLEDVSHAVKGKTFDRLPVLARLVGMIDRQALVELRDLHEEALTAGMEVIERSEQRLREQGERGFPVRVVQTVFELPEDGSSSES
jgi:AcrR family transcriptional regulator